MAAIFALVLVPTLAAVLFMLGAGGGLSFATGLALSVFCALAIGVVGGLFRLAHDWDAAGQPESH